MVAHYYKPQKLFGLVECIAEQHSDRPHRWVFLPDGISTLMFRLRPESRLDVVKAEKIRRHDNPTGESCFLTGFSTRPVHVSFTQFHYIGVYLKPIALKALFGIAAHDLRDIAVEGSLILSDLAEIEDKLNELPTFHQRARWLEDRLHSRIRETPDLHTALAIDTVARKIADSRHRLQSEKLEKLLGYSRAHTHRLFNEWFGLSAGKYQRMVRFIQALDQVHITDLPLTDIGFQQGYFDQAHFIRSFKEFADMTPKEYRKIKTELFAQFSLE